MKALPLDPEALLAKSIPPPAFWASLIAPPGGSVVVSASGGGTGRAAVSLTAITGRADPNEAAAASAAEEPVGLGWVGHQILWTCATQTTKLKPKTSLGNAIVNGVQWSP